MQARLKGLSRARVAIICSAEADVGLSTVQGILYWGEPVRSSQGRRVLRWCQENGYPIQRPEPTPGDAEDALAQAEAQEAARQRR